MYKVNNMSENALNYKYVVAKQYNGEWWFWGSWNDFSKATEAAVDLVNEGVVAVVIPREEVAR